MKTFIITSLLSMATTTFAFEMKLSPTDEPMAVTRLVEIGASSVRCEGPFPICIISGNRYGVQYPGQEIKDVQLTQTSSDRYALRMLLELKRNNLCK